MSPFSCLFHEELRSFLLIISFHRKRFVIYDYSIHDNEFTGKIHFDKDEFVHLIDQYIKEMIKCIKENKIPRNVGWMNNTAFLCFREDPEYFYQCVCLTFKSWSMFLKILKTNAKLRKL